MRHTIQWGAVQSSGTSPSFISLFSGAGGLDLGFHQQGFRSIGSFDDDETALSVLAKNIAAPVYKTDLSLTFPRELVPTRPDVVIAGPPCQGFSTIGARRVDDPRNHLLLSAGEIALSLKPKVVVIENVPGSQAGQHRRFWDRLIEMVRGSGYHTVQIPLQCSEYGIAQKRKRFILLGWASPNDVRVEFPRQPGKVLRDVLADLDGASNHAPVELSPGSIGFQVAQRIGAGQKLCNVRRGSRAVPTWEIPNVYGPISGSEREVLEKLRVERRRNRVRDFGDADPVSEAVISDSLGRSVEHDLVSLLTRGYVRKKGDLYDLTHTFNGKYRRLQWDAPSPTVDTKFGDPRLFLHPQGNRGFTVREAARIQGFPDSFVFEGTLRQQFRQVGNAVPPPVASVIARWIIDSGILREVTSASNR